MILKRGSKGASVHNLQDQLNKAGFILSVDGVFGANTETAVKLFQKTNGLSPDGIVGAKTLAKLQPKPVLQPNGKFNLPQKSLDRLKGVHPDLIKVVKRAIELTTQDFMVLEGARTLEKQKEYVRKGTSKTMKSRHLPSSNTCNMSCAVDLVPIVNGQVSWDWKYYYPIADAVKQAAKEMNVPIEWGGDWTSLKDGPHFQLPWAIYK